MILVDQIIEGEIESIAFGGEGILRYHHFVIFVPFTAVGDRISCRITEVKRSFAKGTVIDLLHSSKDRVKPPCPYFGTCGGCQIQHLNEKAQLTYKQAAVHDALKRIGHLSLPVYPITAAEENWSYRRHITLHLKPKGKGFEAGYIGHDNRSLVVIKECPIFTDSCDVIIPSLQQIVGEISNQGNDEGRVTILKNHRNQYILSFRFGPRFDIPEAVFKKALQHYPQIAGILVIAGNKQLLLGDIYSEQHLEGLNFRFTPQSFIQNHPSQSAAIYREICRLASLGCQKHILDLYCGFGIASLLLASHGHQVTGIETNAQAVQFAKENAVANQLEHVNFLQGDVKNVLPQWLKKNRADFIIVNPPRQGLAKEVVEILSKAPAHSIVYISCMPATLARDVRLLSDHYEVKEGRLYDMFPQTYHVETLLCLHKRSP